MSYNNYGGGVPNPWGNAAGNYQGNPGMGNFGGNTGVNLNNLNTPQAQLAVGLISNLLMQQQQQQQQQQQPQMNMMGMGSMNAMNSAPFGGGMNNPGYSTRSFSPPRRRFRSPSPRRNQARRPAGGAGKSYGDNRRRMPAKRDHQDNQRNKKDSFKRNDGKGDWKKGGKPEAKKEDEVKQGADTEKPTDKDAKVAETEAVAENDEAPKVTEEGQNVTLEETEAKEGGTAEQEKEEKDRKGSEKGDKKNEERGAAYEGLPAAAFRCHLCKKSMWDARSFDNHVHGIAHLRMLDKVEKEYADKAKTLREACHAEELRIQRELEFEARMKNKPLPSRRDFCKMCDMVIYGSVLDHRRSSQHQALKNHLHPKCSTCQIDLPSRIDLDIHVLTADHLRRLFRDVLNKSGKDRKGGRDDRREKPKKKIEPVGEYDPDIAVGEDYMFKVTGIFCKLCRQFFLRDDESLKTHCKTKEHHSNLVAAQNEALKAEAAAEEESEEKKEDANGDEPEAKKVKVEEESEQYDPFSTEEAGEQVQGDLSHDQILDELEADVNCSNFDYDEEGNQQILVENSNVDEDESEEFGGNMMQEDEEMAETAPVASEIARGRGRGGRRGRGRGRGK